MLKTIKSRALEIKIILNEKQRLETINELVSFYKIENSKILIINDDLDLKVGKVKVKFGGSNAGHNGLLSIDRAIGKDYKRLRIGIGHPGYKDQVSSYVLNKFNKNDNKQINRIIDAISKNFSLIFDEEGLFLSKLYNEIKSQFHYPHTW